MQKGTPLSINGFTKNCLILPVRFPPHLSRNASPLCAHSFAPLASVPFPLSFLAMAYADSIFFVIA